MSRNQPIAGNELDEALALVLAEPGARRRADRARVRAFKTHIADAQLQCTGLLVRRGADVSAALVTLHMPGGTALVMPPSPTELGIDPQDQALLLADGMRELHASPTHYIQSLIEPAAHTKRALLTRAGFQRLAVLQYLERDARHPWVDPPPADAAQWIAYAAETHALFAHTVESTYAESQDCPEIAGLRPIDDVLAGHRAAGPFNAALWEIALIQSKPAGCILLSCIGIDMLEVVYMGVAPTHRGSGVGTLLLQRALAHARALVRKRVTLVVDERNASARALYARLGFACVAVRDVYIALPCNRVEKL